MRTKAQLIEIIKKAAEELPEDCGHCEQCNVCQIEGGCYLQDMHDRFWDVVEEVTE